MFAFELPPILAELYNTSIKQGFLPSLLKSAVVCPLPKRRPPKSIERDVRPISLTSHTPKIMEGFTLSRVLPCITERLDPKQFAMAGEATQHAIVYLLHLTLEALDQGNCWARWFFADFKKGFDLVDHRILLDKLKLLEVYPRLLRWIASFPEGRSQVVRIASSSSPFCKLNGEALNLASKSTLQDRRSAACHEIVAQLNADNPVYKLVASRLESTSASARYSLRSRARTKITATNRFGDFLTNKYATAPT